MTAMKEMEMQLTTTEPKFFVVIVLDPVAEEFQIGAIFSAESDAEQYRAERMEDPAYRGCAVIDTMTMEQIKATLVKDRLMVLAVAVEKLVQQNVKVSGPMFEGPVEVPDWRRA